MSESWSRSWGCGSWSWTTESWIQGWCWISY